MGGDHPNPPRALTTVQGLDSVLASANAAPLSVEEAAAESHGNLGLEIERHFGMQNDLR